MKTNYIGNHGVCYGITPNGEYFSYNPEKNGSYYHDTEEEARLSAIKINKMLDKKEMDSIKDFNRINAMESIQKKNTVKLNESQLKKIVAESVKNVLLENSFHSSNPFETSDAEVNLKKAIHELEETVNILETFCKDGMNKKHLLKMAQAYGERGMRLLGMAVSSAR